MSSMMDMIVLVFGGGIMLGMAINFLVGFNTTTWPTQVSDIWDNVPLIAMLIFIVGLLVLVRKVM